MISLLHAKSRFLLGITRPKNLQGWNRLTNKLLLKQKYDKERERESMLEAGEVGAPRRSRCAWDPGHRMRAQSPLSGRHGGPANCTR